MILKQFLDNLTYLAHAAIPAIVGASRPSTPSISSSPQRMPPIPLPWNPMYPPQMRSPSPIYSIPSDDAPPPTPDTTPRSKSVLRDPESSTRGPKKRVSFGEVQYALDAASFGSESDDSYGDQPVRHPRRPSTPSSSSSRRRTSGDVFVDDTGSPSSAGSHSLESEHRQSRPLARRESRAPKDRL